MASQGGSDGKPRRRVWSDAHASPGPLGRTRERPGAADALRLLSQHDANPDIQDNTRLTPLMRACGAGNCEAVRALLEAAADASLVDEHGKTALMHAGQSNRGQQIAQLLNGEERE